MTGRRLRSDGIHHVNGSGVHSGTLRSLLQESRGRSASTCRENRLASILPGKADTGDDDQPSRKLYL